MIEDEERPNPDELLKAVTSEEAQVKKGRLKVFLGMAAGVGKTYAMLDDAHNEVKEGKKVMVGIVSTHGRKETEELLQGLAVIPPKRIKYRDTTFDELDLEKILEIKPDLVLVDELAHSNIPGSRHPKRWQDVVEILDNGIDVATTVNVQHLDSLKDVVETITGIPIRETVPDSVLEHAAYIEMIDLTPEELLQRLKEGKVYLGDQADVAREHFFKEDRLTALRELALRFAAEKVDHDLRGMVSTVERVETWKPRERLMVAVSHSPHSQKLIRTTRRLAFTLNAPWIALHVDTGMPLAAQESQMLAKNLQLARDLGADVYTMQDEDVADAIERVARQKQVSQIIVGRSPEKARWWRRAPLVDRLAQECKDVDIHIVRQMQVAKAPRQKKPVEFALGVPYFAIFCAILALTFVNMFLEPYVGYRVVGFLYLIGIALLSLFYGKGPVFFGALLSGLMWDYFFIPPIGSFIISSNEDALLLSLYVITASVTGLLTDKARKQRSMLLRREETSQALYEIVRLISSSPASGAIVHAVREQLEEVMHAKIDFYILRPDNGLNFPEGLDTKERATATWVFENDKEAGWSTDTLAAAACLYIPLKGYQATIGVMSYRPEKRELLTHQEKNFLYTTSQQLAYYLERRFIEESERQQELIDQVERIYSQMLKSFTGQTVVPQAIRGERILKQHLELSDMNEMLKNGVETMQAYYKEHHFELTIGETLPKITIDQVQIELLLGNLLAASADSAPPKTAIRVSSNFEENSITIKVEHEGISTGKEAWGLAVARLIATAHKGSLTEEPLHPKGTRFCLQLPLLS